MYVILDLDKNFDYPELIGIVSNKHDIDKKLCNHFGKFEFTSLRRREDELDFEQYGEIMYGNVTYGGDQICKIVVLRDV